MPRIQLLHHVYSSSQGYRTLKTSAGVPPPTVEALEEVSAKMYPKAKSAPRFSVFPPDDIFLCCSMNVLSGVDHVGRTRSLVHNILIRREALKGQHGFNHLFLPASVYMKPGEDIRRGLKNLPAYFEFNEESLFDFPSRFDRDTLPRKCALHLLRILLGDRPAVIRSEKGTAYARILKVSGLLPADIREPLAMINGLFLPEFSDLGHPTVFLVPKDFDLSAAVREGYAALDVSAMKGYNLPRPHPWDRFVVGHLTAGDPHDDLKTLLKVLNHFRPLSRYTPEAFQALIEGFESARRCFEQNGRLDVKRAPSDGLRATGKFFKAGHPDIVFDVFLGCLQLLGARELSDQVQQFGRMIAEGAELLIPLFRESTEVSVDELDFDV